MNVQKFNIDGPILLKPRVFEDNRGYFMESFHSRVFSEAIYPDEAFFVQDNQSFSKNKGTVRGLHYQSPPHAQGKLVRCSQGSILDVAVDARIGSSTFGKHISAELSSQNAYQLWVPAGFLHGFSTLEDDTIVQYKCTDYYDPNCDGNVAWNDPSLGIDWKITRETVIVSAKDNAAPLWSDFNSPFLGPKS